MTEITAQEVKSLRDRTGAGMMDCRNALKETDGDIEKAVEVLRAKGQAQAAKRAGAEVSEGAVQSYIHAGNQIGVLVEVNCQTDFVARNDAFVEFARDLALHIAAARPLAVADDDIPSEEREREARLRPPSAPGRRRARGSFSPTSMPATRSASSSRSTARPTSSRATRSSSSSPATWPCRSRPRLR